MCDDIGNDGDQNFVEKNSNFQNDQLYSVKIDT